MAEIVPFRGILYNMDRLEGGDVVSPPYDIITPSEREALYKKSPFNIVRIDSGEELEGDSEEENKYLRAQKHLSEWLKEGILVKDDTPSFYAYEMRYEMQGKMKSTLGFFGLVRLEELGRGIYPHEATHSKPKTDRLSLLAACRANTSPIFSIYRSPERKASEALKKAASEKPRIEAEDKDGAVHRLWPVSEPASIKAICEDLSGRAIFIADGHHRYETALEYRNSMRLKNPAQSPNAPLDYVLMFLANIEDGGLTILPAHRLVKSHGDIIKLMKGHMSIEALPEGSDIPREISGKTNAFGLYLEGKGFVLKYGGGETSHMEPALGSLDVAVLHDAVLKKLLTASEVGYEMDWRLCVKMVDGGRYKAAFFLNPTTVEEVEAVALSLNRMPPKSTYFYPKVMTGFVINSFENSF